MSLFKEAMSQVPISGERITGIGSIVQNDKGANKFTIKLMDGLKPFNITGATGITFSVLKPDGTTCVDGLGERISIVDAVAGLVSVSLHDDAITVCGTCTATLEVYVGTTKISSSRMSYLVVGDLMSAADVTAASTFPVLTEVLVKINSMNSSTAGASGAEWMGSKAIEELKDPDNQALSALTVWKQIKAIVSLLLALPSKVETLVNKTIDGAVMLNGLYLNAAKDAGVAENVNGDVVIYGTNGNREVALRLKPKIDADSLADMAVIESRETAYALWHSGNDGPTSGMSAQFAAEATKLATTRRINGVAFDGTADIKMVGECATAGDVSTKVVTFASNFALTPNVLFGVRFFETNTASDISLVVAGSSKRVSIGQFFFSPLCLRSYQVYLFVYNLYGNTYDLVGYESQGNLVLLQDVGNYFTSTNAEGAFQEVGAHLTALDASIAARYTKTDMETSGHALMHWDNITNKPNLADNHWKTPVANQAALPLAGNTIEDCRVVLDDGDGKQAVYLCIATTGTLAQQWSKIADVDWMTEEQTRIAQENARQSEEAVRINSENQRFSNETNRELKENQRNSHEQSRESAETARVSVESARVTAENLRKANETDRQTYEARRAFIEPYNAGHSYFAQQKVTYAGSTYQALNNMSAGTHLPTETDWWICIAKKGDNTTAADVTIADAAGKFVSGNTEGALAELATHAEETAALVSTKADQSDLEATDTRLTHTTDSLKALTEASKSVLPDVTYSGYDYISALSSNAAEKSLSVKLTGQTATNLVTNGNFANGTTGFVVSNIGTPTVSNGICSFTSIAQYGYIQQTTANYERFKGHRVLFVCKVTSASNLLRLSLNDGVANTILSSNGSGTEERLFAVKDISASATTLVFKLQDDRPSGWTETKCTEFMIVDLTSIGYSSLTAAQAAAKFPHYFDGTKSVEVGTLETVGKNLFDKRKTINGYNLTTSGILEVQGVSTTSEFIKVSKATTYFRNYASDSNGRICFYDSSKVFISYLDIAANASFVTPTNCCYLRMAMSTIAVDAIQLELGSTATTYQPYTQATQYTPPITLRSVPNGVADTLEPADGGLRWTKKVEKKILQAVDVLSMNTSYANVDYARILKMTDYKYATTEYATTNAILNSVSFVNYPASVSTNYTVAAEQVGFMNLSFSATSFYVGFTKGTTLTQAQAALAGTEIEYQLATPVITDLLPSPLFAKPSGSVIYNASRGEVGFYTTNLGVTDTDLPIKALKSLAKVDAETGAETPLNVSTAVIAGDGLTFTHSGLVSGDLVTWDYEFDWSKTLMPLIEYGYNNGLTDTITFTTPTGTVTLTIRGGSITAKVTA